MAWSYLANGVVVLHLLFILFVVAGGVLVWRWPRTAWLHLPAVCWGALIEFRGWICPLTPLENHLRRRAGEAGYPGDFLEHYVIPLIYPADLTPHTQLALGLALVFLNLLLYGSYGLRRSASRRRRPR
ncbi:MAG TPA: DUF2784 domain-containing protein [Gemmatimonadales bacterium]|nr:DUF2784 domain-containing protein [Gemmatimonadales bacterium]